MMKHLIGLVCASLFISAAWSTESPVQPSPAPISGKSVRSKIEQPKHGEPVGVRAADPSQNGRVDTSGALSPINANSMGAGFQFDLTKPKTKASDHSVGRSREG